jgi:hypothetical protein
MYYSPKNEADSGANGFGVCPVVTVDVAMSGSYNKELLVNSSVAHTYQVKRSDGGTDWFPTVWLHLKLEQNPDGSVKKPVKVVIFWKP